ncbi:MAG: hypothetical protein ACK5XZ_07000 [Hyphomonadaceae bacterium]|jgi:hypothetical protein|uniref:hypothetical protein n=1 Tax=Aquidulcibacter sp. TaxID=2052990 RepID=UPI0022C1C252|nr:hypothetical protein [Aquidulcibacter sp.]MCE2891225.1 hypothetical protein [Hyphomonadaceae bacterium]MCZ8206649.1 hypothetical protein [Aquidulcibacter sp.]
MRSILLGVALSGLFAGPALAQCVYVACPGSSGSSSSSSSSSASSTLSQYEVTQTVTSSPGTNETFVREEVVREPEAHSGHHAQHQQHTQHAYRHGYREGYRDGYADRGKPKARATKTRTRAAAVPSSHRRPASKPKRPQSTVTNSSAWVHDNRPYVDPIKDRASTYDAASNGSAISLASESSVSSSSTWSSSSSMSNWSSQGGMASWPAPAMPMQQGGMICGWSIQTTTTPDGHTLPPQQTWVCQCPQGWRPPGY